MGTQLNKTCQWSMNFTFFEDLFLEESFFLELMHGADRNFGIVAVILRDY